jgi:hypothetical protein
MVTCIQRADAFTMIGFVGCFHQVPFLLNEYLKRGFLFGKQVLATRLFALWVSQPRSLGCGKSVAEMIKHRSGQRHQLII